MKLAIISDTHGNLEGWRRALELAGEGANLIVPAGMCSTTGRSSRR